ncbi:MAG: SDR family oxidoreductase [Pseudomonadota bacterium]|nr:SDR family oxidoreductase [Pseudomonadota bacterium]
MTTDPIAASRSILVTGGGRGIGAAASLLCAARGWAVGVNYTKDRAAAERIVETIRSRGGSALALQADVADDAAVRAMFSTVDRELPPLAGLVNNAGVLDTPSRVDGLGVERLQRMFAVNVFGSFYCAREAVLRMKGLPPASNGSRGSIVNLSSAAAKLGGAGQYVDYAAAKGAIESFTFGLAKEIAGEGIRVNAVRPGLIETEIHASGGSPDRARQMAPLVPMQRPGSAEEVGEAIVWLLSDASSYTTGSIIEVTGGR